MTSRPIVFRADASLDMGTGHVMRCLTLADAMREQGYACHFICREHPGNLIEFIRAQGHQAYSLTCPPMVVNSCSKDDGSSLAHAAWLAASQHEDAVACQELLEQIKPQWLVVDHYALDSRWEQMLKPYYGQLMVIDDLADRSHQCDLLLDQTFGRSAEDYTARVPANCNVLCGTHFALLRPEFAKMRMQSLQRRKNPEVKHILVTMGGVDSANTTGSILDGLDKADLPDGCEVTVVMGTSAPWLDSVRQQAASTSYPTTVLAGVSNMARLMTDSDLTIGAAGSTSWERCCLGLPAVMLVLADNQELVAAGLQAAGAVVVLPSADAIDVELPRAINGLLAEPFRMERMSAAGARLVDGLGVQRVVDAMGAYDVL